MALRTDPIMTKQQAQRVFDFNDNDNLEDLVNALSSKARASMGRVQLNQILDTAIVENRQGIASNVMFLRAPVYDTDFSTHDLTVEYYSSGAVEETWSANDGEVMVITDDFYSKISLMDECFPAATGSDFIRVTYFGGWAEIPGDVFQGAIQQGRVDLKRMKGEVGFNTHSANGESIRTDRNGVVQETSTLWGKYKVLA